MGKKNVRTIRKWDKYEALASEGRKYIGVAVGKSRPVVNRAVTGGTSLARKVTGMAKFRLLGRVKKLEDTVRAPFLYDDHGLEEYVRMIVRSEKKVKR